MRDELEANIFWQIGGNHPHSKPASTTEYIYELNKSTFGTHLSLYKTIKLWFGKFPVYINT